MRSEQRYKVLIVEDDARYAEPLKSCLNQSKDFVTMAVTDSAVEALRIVRSGLPDAMIVDLQLDAGEGDGMQLLQEIHDMKEELSIAPYTLVLTSVTSEKTKERLNRGLADYTFSKRTKNYHPNLILGHLRIMSCEFDCHAPAKQKSLSAFDEKALIRTRVERELNQYYIKPGNEAKDFLIDAICIAVAMPPHERLRVKDLFVAVGKIHGKTTQNMNVRIDHLIQQAFLKTDESDLEKAYTPYRDISRTAPTPKAFIIYIADKIRKEDLF